MAPPAKKRRTTRAAAAAASAAAEQEQQSKVEEHAEPEPTQADESQVAATEDTPMEDTPMETDATAPTEPAPQPKPKKSESKSKKPAPKSKKTALKSKKPEPKAEPVPEKPEAKPEEPEAKPEEPEPAPEVPVSKAEPPSKSVEPQSKPEEPKSKPNAPAIAGSRADQMARFKALQARRKDASETNLKEATRESHRLASDPSQLATLQRRQAIASQKLLKADTEDAGEDFERKRAWDWTIDESERWDKRVKKREGHADMNAFQDYAQESNKVYKRQLRNLNPDMERYEKEKMATIEKAAASGGLEIVETEDGELIAVDKDGSFYSTADSTTFTQNKPDKAAVDRLVDDIRKAEEHRLKKRKERMAKNGDDGDVTYINDQNKQFNQKLSRFYNKYTAEIRDSFERGTMI